MTQKNLKKNVIYQITYQLLLIIIPFLTSPYISRVLGAEGIGTYSYTYSIANYFVLFAKLGIDNYGNREIAKNRENKVKLNQTFSSIFYMHLIVSLSILVIYFVFIFHFDLRYRKFLFIQSLYIIATIVDINWMFFGLEEFKITVTRNAIVKISTVIAVFLFVKNSHDTLKYILIFAVGYFLSQSVVWIFAKKYIQFQKFEWNHVKKHFFPMCTLFIPAIAVSLYKVMDKIMLGSMSNVIQSGYYENAEKILNTCIGVIIAFGNVMLPRMSNLNSRGDEKQLMRYIRISMQMIMFLTIGMMFGLIGISKVFTPVFWGDGYNTCIWLINGLAITLPFMAFANIIRTQYLLPKNYDRIYIISVFVGAIVNIVLNLILIKNLKAMGAVIGTVCAEAAVCIVQAYAVRKELPLIYYIRNSIYYIFSGAATMLIVQFLGKILCINISTLFLQISIGVFAYIAISFPYLKITKNDLYTFICVQFKNSIKKYSKKYTKY